MWVIVAMRLSVYCYPATAGGRARLLPLRLYSIAFARVYGPVEVSLATADDFCPSASARIPVQTAMVG